MDDQLGWSVSLSDDGNTALVGVSKKTITDTNGVANLLQGAAYVFVRNGTTWSQQQSFIASDGTANDELGAAVSLSSDGNTALVGASNKTINSYKRQGAAYIFTRIGTTWTQQPQLTDSKGMPYDNFGGAVSLSGDGNTALIGASVKATSQGAAYIFSLSTTTTNTTGLVYYPLPKPIRVLDTRAGQTALYNGSNGYPKFTAGQTVNYNLAGITFGGYSIPAEAQVVVANLSAVNPTGQGYLTLYPGPADLSGANRPLVSSLNYRNAAVTSNTSYLAVGTNGTVNAYSVQATDLVLDISGYYAPAGTADPNSFSTGLLYYPLPKPIRVLDTRAGQAALYGGGGTFMAGQTKNYTLASITYGGYSIPAAAKALVANTTAVSPAANGFLTIYPGSADTSGANRPSISSMNYRSGDVTTSGSYPTLDAGGVANIYSVQATDVIMDISGYFAPAGTTDLNSSSITGFYYTPLAKPIRVLDTRVGAGALYSDGRFTAGATKNYALAGISSGGYSIPAEAKVVVANTTAVSPAANGFLTIYPGPADTSGANRPTVSSLNYRSAFNTTSNPSHVTISSLGVANIYSVQATDVIMDISGYYR
jgi:hypothetical protein